ncbi:MAG: D-2-hydroxyacid dehydrogenase [Clostridiales Family XIII bacterium]|jgi:glycerate dehydrogenase|nr:D-2-hydroxyacid dehydrogenase [Clostridiales Family XIII bacterium]
MRKAVVLDGYTLNPGDLEWTPIEKLAALSVYDRTTFDPMEIDKIVERVGDAEIILDNKTPIKYEALKRMPHLKYIGMLSTGYDVVDVNAARELGITVTNIPTYGTNTVSQMAIAMLLEMCHHIGAHDASVKEGRWANNADWCYWDYPIIELAGKTMGIIGYGRIGQATGRIAQAMDMKVIAYDRFQRPELESATMKYTDLDDLYAKADVIALHCPLTDENRGMINKESIRKMKDDVLIINNSRGPLIVEQDLADALNSGKVKGAALDVVSTEPIKENNPLLKAKNCLLTPHISWASKEARQRIMDMAADNLEQFLKGTPINVVNP